MSLQGGMTGEEASSITPVKIGSSIKSVFHNHMHILPHSWIANQNPFARLIIILTQSYVSTIARVLSDNHAHSCLSPDLNSGLKVMRVVSLYLMCFKYLLPYRSVLNRREKYFRHSRTLGTIFWGTLDTLVFSLTLNKGMFLPKV